MKSFEYVAPKTLKDAVALLGESWGKTEILAGGTDLVTLLKQNLVAPDRLISLKNITELKGIKSDRAGVRIGATTTLRELAEHSAIKEQFPALVTAANGIGSAQMLAAGTVGGDLCQRPRCWYFRNGFGVLGKEGPTSLAREGENRYHAIFATDGPALFVHPSSLAPALIALGATLTVASSGGKTRKIPAADFFQTPRSNTDRETVLRPNEILTEIMVPSKGLKNATYEVRHRHGLDWPYVTASVAFQMKNGTASDARIVLGHVAPVPWPADSAAKGLAGAIDETAAAKAGDAALRDAKPLSGNAYKVQMAKTAVKRALLAAAKA